MKTDRALFSKKNPVSYKKIQTCVFWVEKKLPKKIYAKEFVQKLKIGRK